MANYVACPKCGSADAEMEKFTWWGGILGPRLLTHVKCPACSHKYNGKSGKDNTTGIVIYCVVVGIFAFFLMIFAVAALFGLMNL